jgi:hypothetical protein
VAAQAIRALAHQALTFVLTTPVWACWLTLWLVITLQPLGAGWVEYWVTFGTHGPPAGLWIGLLLVLAPLTAEALTVLYGLWGGVRCLAGHDFRYAVVGDRLVPQR